MCNFIFRFLFRFRKDFVFFCSISSIFLFVGPKSIKLNALIRSRSYQIFVKYSKDKCKYTDSSSQYDFDAVLFNGFHVSNNQLIRLPLLLTRFVKYNGNDRIALAHASPNVQNFKKKKKKNSPIPYPNQHNIITCLRLGPPQGCKLQQRCDK